MGRAYGARGTTLGEVVFATGMTGYQETLTDPSYAGQIVLQTAPHIGNTGMNDEDMESAPHLGRRATSCATPPASCRTGAPSESSTTPSSSAGIVGISGIDTRAVTRHIRSAGSHARRDLLGRRRGSRRRRAARARPRGAADGRA